MKLIFLSIEFSIATFSGNGVYATSQVRALQQLGHDVLVVCGCPATSPPSPEDAPTLIPIPLPVWGRLDLECAWQEFALGCGSPTIAKRIGEFQAEAILGVDWHSIQAYEQLAASLRSHAFSVPPYSCSNYRVYLRSSQTDHEKEIIRKLEGASLQRSISSSVLSRSDQDFVKRYYYPDVPVEPPRLHVLLPALRADIAALPMPENTPRRRYLTCCVRASPEKEPHRFVDMLCELQRRGVFQLLDIVPLIAGSGWKVEDIDFSAVQNDLSSSTLISSVQRYAFDLRQKLAAEVSCCRVIESFLGPKEMTEIYAETALNFHPPAYDAYGMTIVEAASQGAPSLVAHAGHVGATDLLDPGKDQIFVTDMEADIPVLADVVQALLEDQQRLVRLGAAAARVAREWTEVSNAATLVEMIKASLEEIQKGKTTAVTTMTSMVGDDKLNYPMISLHNNNNSAANGAGIRDDDVAIDAVDDLPSSPDSTNITMYESRGGVDVLPAVSLDYETFENRYLAANRPVILTGVTNEWRATKEWVNPEGGVDIDFLASNFRDLKVMATDTAVRHRGGGPCKELTLKEYTHWWKEHKKERKEESQYGEVKDSGKAVWYVKDWHFAADVPNYNAYVCPEFFQDDWLNEWYDASSTSRSSDSTSTGTVPHGSVLDSNDANSTTDIPDIASTSTDDGTKSICSDYRFVYLGPSGSSTPLHADVLRSHSWSANIVGRKRWRLLPAEYSHLVRDSTGFSHPYDFFLDDDSSSEEERRRFPGLEQAREQILEIVQYPGEAIFVPSNWWHTVYNLDDCLSINHNWISTHSVGASWEYLKAERARAAALIEDCREICGVGEFEGLVQRNVGANAGMDYAGFGGMVRHVACAAAKLVVERSKMVSNNHLEGRPSPLSNEIRNEGAKNFGNLPNDLTSRPAPHWLTFKAAVERLKRARDVLEEMVKEQRGVLGETTTSPEEGIVKESNRKVTGESTTWCTPLYDGADEAAADNLKKLAASEEEAAVKALSREIALNVECLELITSALRAAEEQSE